VGDKITSSDGVREAGEDERRRGARILWVGVRDGHANCISASCMCVCMHVRAVARRYKRPISGTSIHVRQRIAYRIQLRHGTQQVPQRQHRLNL